MDALTVDRQERLRGTLAAFLTAYGSTDFANYLEFRNPATMAAADDPRLAQRLEAGQAGWDDRFGPVPTDAVSFMETAWRLYVKGDMEPILNGPVMESVNWRTCQVRVRTLPERNVVPAEWRDAAGTESHFYKSFVSSGRGAVSPMVMHLGVPNRRSVEEIVEDDGALNFADFEIVLRTGKDSAHPILARFVWDTESGRWLPLNAMKLWNNPRKPFIW